MTKFEAMTKHEFIGKIKEMLAMNAIYPEIKGDLDSVIQEAIDEHEQKQWKKYPENRPVKYRLYDVTLDDGTTERWLYMQQSTWRRCVIAFREPPESYKPKTDKP